MSIKRTIITAATIVVSVAMVASVVGAQTPTVAQLMAQLAALQSQLSALQGAPAAAGTGACTGVTFTRNLTVGATGSDVKCLQQILSVTPQSGYFGPKTLAAVKAYQTANGMTAANQVGPMTRAKLNASLGSVTPGTPVVTPVTGSVSATLASDNPSSGAVVNNQARAGLLNINFTGTGTVTSVTLQRSGISTSNTLSSVYLFDGATRLTSGYSFNTNGQLVMNGLNIAVNGSHEISVAGDVYTAATADSSSIAVAMIGYTANGSTVSANVMGNSMAVVAGSAATANFPTGLSVSPLPTIINAGSINQTLWSQQISISPRAVMFYGMTVKMIGSAPTNSLANVNLYVDGTLVGTSTINANNQFVFAVSNPVTLTTGSHLIEVRGDVVGGATRSFYLSLEQGSDVALKDSQLGVYIATVSNGGTTAASNVNGGLVTLGGVIAGTANITVNQDTTFSNTTTLVGGVANTTLASFTFTAYGEDTKVTDITFTPSITGQDAGSHSMTTLSNVGLYINGGQIGSNKTATNNSPLEFSNLGSQLTVALGSPVTVSIKGDVISSATDPSTYVNTNYASGTISFAVASGMTQGLSSQTTGILPTSVGGQSLSVSSSNVIFGATTGYAATTAAPNSTVQLGSFTLQTGSAEGVTLNNISVTFPAGTNTLVTANQLSNLTVRVNGVTVGSPIGQPVIITPNNFSVSIPVSISSTAKIDVYGTIGSSTTPATVAPSMLVTYRGTTSNLTGYTGGGAVGTPVTSVTALTGVASIVTAGVSLVPSASLSAQFVSGNSSTALPIATFNVAVGNGVGGAVLKDLTFAVNANTISSVTVNGKTGTVVGTSVTVPSVGITVPSDSSGVNIPVTVQLVPVGQGSAGVSNSAVKLVLTGATYNNGSTVATVAANADGSGSTTINVGPQGGTALALVGSVPTIQLANSSTSGLTLGKQQIGTFTIAAGNGGDIKVQTIPFSVTIGGATASTTLASVELDDANGNALNGTPGTPTGTLSAGLFTFPSTGRTITKGTSETYTVYATIGGTLGTTTGSSSVTFNLAPKASFTWTDVAGSTLGSNTNIAGTNIYGYSTNSQTKTN